MSTTPAPTQPHRGQDSWRTGVPSPELRSLDVRGTLAAATAARRTADRAEAELLALAVHLVDLHPVIDGTALAVWDAEVLDGPRPSLAGTGTPEVAERAVEELGAALGVSYRAALALVSDAVELCFRLPRLWALVHAGRLRAWKARRVAAHTLGLSAAAVEFVDRHVAVVAVHNRVPGNLQGLVHEAWVRTDPDKALAREEALLSERDVTFHLDGETAATASMTATLDLLDAVDLDATISDLATSMGRLGDDSSLGERRSHALGMLAHPQRVLDIFGGALGDETPAVSAPEPATDAAALLRGGARATSVDRWSTGAPHAASCTLYVHVTAADLATSSLGTGACGRVERLGGVTADRLHDWLRRLDHVTVRPLLDGRRDDAADRHDPPEWMREVVALRDGHCVFPGCTVDARTCDQDHIVPYVPPDEGGPPGQTSVDALACLCRRHHRLKTHTGWDYHRLPDGTYEWTSADGAVHHTAPGPRG